MNDLIFLIIIWIVIALFNALVKKMRSGQTTAKPARPSSRPTPGREEPRLPPFLEELFGMGKEEAPASLPVESVAEEEIPQAQPLTAPEEEKEEYSFKMPLLGAAKTETVTEASASEIAYRIPLKKRVPSNLKAAVIWKEILDLPVSLRSSPFAAFRNK